MSTVYSAALKRDAAAGKKRASENDAEGTQTRRNKQRVLVLPSRGVTTRMRHLVNDVEALLPHAKKGTLRDSHRIQAGLQVGSFDSERACRAQQLQRTCPI